MTKEEELKKESKECMHDILFWLNLSINKENIEKGSSYILKLLESREKQIEELNKENTELKKNYEDSLVACGVFKEKIELLSKPSPVEAMQDALITTQKEVNKKQRDQLTKAKDIIQNILRVTWAAGWSYSLDWKVRAESFLKEIGE